MELHVPQVGRRGNGMKLKRIFMAHLAEALSGNRLSKVAQAAAAAYQGSSLRILWVDAGFIYFVQSLLHCLLQNRRHARM